jgi:beta-phosphoglucomutase-like phosphatase (HAD superfamily)
MMRDTRTGRAYEQIIERVLDHSGLTFKRQQMVGTKPGGRQHMIDYLAWDPARPDRKALISCKAQNTAGTAEEKLPYEVIKLLHAMDNCEEYVAAYMVLGGTGWTPEYVAWIKRGLARYIPEAERVRMLTTDELISHHFRIDERG